MPATLLLTDDLAESLANAVRRGVPIETACQAAGIGSRTFFQWLEIANGGRSNGATVTDESKVIIERFARLIASAQADFEAHQIASIAEAGEAVGRSGIPEWRARAWLLNNHPRYRKTYRQERQLEVHNSGTVQHEHTIAQAASDDELRSWAAIELPEPTA